MGRQTNRRKMIVLSIKVGEALGKRHCLIDLPFLLLSGSGRLGPSRQNTAAGQ
jgi:hypothetical protein